MCMIIPVFRHSQMQFDRVGKWGAVTSVSGCITYHMLGFHVPLGFMICTKHVSPCGHVQDSFQALAFCASTGPGY